MSSKIDKTENLKNIITKYGNMLFRICYCILCNRQDAEDALQDTMVKYATKSPEFNDEEYEKAWLIKVATNISKNMLITRKKRKCIDIDELIDIGTHDDDIGVFNAVMDLPVKYKIVMTLYYIEGYSVRQVSEITSVSEAAVRKRLQKGRELLKLEIERGNRNGI